VGASFHSLFFHKTPCPFFLFTLLTRYNAWESASLLAPTTAPGANDEYGGLVAAQGSFATVGTSKAGRVAIFYRNSTSGTWRNATSFTPGTASIPVRGESTFDTTCIFEICMYEHNGAPFVDPKLS
jgi:hypothetical protein